MKPLEKIIRYGIFPLAALVATWFVYVFLVYGFWVHWLWTLSAVLLVFVVAVAAHMRRRGSATRGADSSASPRG